MFIQELPCSDFPGVTGSSLKSLRLFFPSDHCADHEPYPCPEQHRHDAVHGHGLSQQMHSQKRQEDGPVADQDGLREHRCLVLLHPQADACCQGNEAHEYVIVKEPGKDVVWLGLDAEQDAPPFHDGQEPEGQRQHRGNAMFVPGGHGLRSL